MRINELLTEQNQLDELSLAGVSRGLGRAAGAVGSAVGGVKGTWQGMKNAYGQKKDRVANVAQRTTQRAGGYRTPPVQTGTNSTQPTQVGTNSAPATGATRPYVAPSSSGTNAPTTPDPKALRQQAAELTRQADEIEKQTATEPTPAAAGANAFGQMAGQLRAKAPPETSSTGGTTQQTATGQVHTASPNNINQTPSSGTTQQTAGPNNINQTPSDGTAEPAPAGANAFGQMAGQLNATTPSAAPQVNGPKVNGLQVRNMGESKKLKFRSNFLGIDI